MATTIEKVYKLNIEGVDSVNDLKKAIEELNAKLQTLNETSQAYKDTLQQLTEYQNKLADAMKEISDTATNTSDSLGNVKKTLEDVSDNLSKTADESVKVKQNLEEMGQAQNVKELKQQIKDLRDDLVTLDKGSEDYKDTVSELIDREVKLKEVMSAGKNEVHAAEGSYNALSQRMSALKQVWKETTDEATRNEIGKEIKDINDQLKNLDYSLGNHQRNVGNYKSVLDGVEVGTGTWKNELRACKEALQQLDPTTKEYADTMARAAELQHNLSEQMEQIKYASPDLGDQLSNVRGIASNMAAGFGAVNAAMGLFGEKNEEVQQALLKVQQIMGLVQGLQGMDGFLKRTKGLSDALGLTNKALKANATAIKADATASMQDAAAKEAQTVATEGVIPAQTGLNTVMKANPIGFIIGLIAALITAYALLKGKIKEIIGGSEEMTKVFNQVKVVATGVGNALKKYVFAPVKVGITELKMFSKVLRDVFTGNWSEIGNDFKDGFNEIVDEIKEGYNLIGNYNQAANEKQASINAEARKKEAEARKKEVNDTIKDNEAKYGSDFKYTEKGIKLYREYFEKLSDMYDEDSDDYKEAQREKWEFERELSERQFNERKDQLSHELDLMKSRYGDEYEYSKQWYAKEQKLYQDTISKYGFASLNDSNAKKIIEDAEIRWNNYVQKYNNFIEKQTKSEGDSYKKLAQDFSNTFKKYMDEATLANMNINELVKKWNQGIEPFQQTLINDFKFTVEQVNEITATMINNFYKSMFNDASKAISNGFSKEINAIDRKMTEELAKLAKEYERKKLTIGIEFPSGELAYIEELFQTAMQGLKRELELSEKEIDEVLNEILVADEDAMTILFGEEKLSMIKEDIEKVKNLYLEHQKSIKDGNEDLAKQIYDNLKNSSSTKIVEEAFGLNLSEFQLLLDKRNALFAKMDNTRITNFKSRMAIIKQCYDEEIQTESNYYSNLFKLMELEMEHSKAQKDLKWNMHQNEIEDLKKEAEFSQWYYNTQMEMYQNMLDRYTEMSNDMLLSDEERNNARLEADKLINEILMAEIDRDTQVTQQKIANVQAWKKATTDAISAVGNIMGTVSDAWGNMIELEKNAIQTELQAGKISQAEADRREAENMESFEKLKNFQIAQTIINGLSGAISAYQSLASIPYVGPFLGAAAAAAVAAATAVNVKQIKSTNYQNGGSTSSGSNNYDFQLPDVMEYEPQLQSQMTNQSNIDTLNNDGINNNNEHAIRAYVVESDINAVQRLSNRRNLETTF